MEYEKLEGAEISMKKDKRNKLGKKKQSKKCERVIKKYKHIVIDSRPLSPVYEE